MKLREIFRFELAYQLRRPSTWIRFALLFGFAFFIMGAGSPSNDEVFPNAPFMIAFGAVLAGVVWMLLGASVAGEAAARDVQTGMHPLTYTLPVSKAGYLGGRFLAAFVINALLLLALPAGMPLVLLLRDASGLGPIRPAAYLTTYAFITLPFAFAVTAIQFASATLQRRGLASYLASVVIFVASLFGLLTVAKLLGRWELVRLLDLVGISGIVGVLGDTLTPFEMNTRLIALDPTLLLNRLIWLGIAAAALGLTYLRVRLAHVAEGTRRSRIARRRGPRSAAPAAAIVAKHGAVVVPEAARPFALSTSLWQVLGIGWASFRAIARSRVLLVLVALFALHLVVFMSEYVKFMGVPMLPATERILGFLTAPVGDIRTPLVVIPVLIAFIAGELYWRERDAGVSEITDAAPVPEWALFLGKFLGLAFILVAWLAVLATTAMVAQLVMGYRDLQPALYLEILFGLQLPEYLLFACLALALHVVVNQKYAGHIVAVAALALIALAHRLGIHHNLLIYSSSPAWSYTELRGFGGSVGPWLWFKLYWAAWALLLAVAAKLLWARGREGAPGTRLRLARHRFTGRTAAMAGAALGLVVALGGFVYYNTNVLNRYDSFSASAADAAEYERRYHRYLGIPQPMLAATRLRVEIQPARRAVLIRGSHRLVNRTASPIDSIHVATVPDVRTGALAFDRPATRVYSDAALGHHIYALAQPLQPGESVTLRFEVHRLGRGFRNGGADAAVGRNYSMFSNDDLLPAVGYQAGRELRDADSRRKHGLTANPSLPASLHDTRARFLVVGGELIDFEAVVGTDEGQVAIAPGALRRTWTQGGRRYFQYATDAPIRNEYGFFSAAYALREARWHDVAIQVFHHPRHTANVERMVRSIQTSLTRYTAEFGPYPYRHIRFIERAGGQGGMSADASSIAYDEGFSSFNPGDPERGLDLPFYVVAHEVAHQWWGTQLSSALVEGFWLMSESLAVYSGMQVLREAYGQDQVRRYLDLVRSIYRFPRSRAAVPLLRANESFLGYRKGPIALYALSRYIGEERVNEALRRTLEKYATGVPPLPTSLDLYRELQAITPDSMRYVLHDLFEANTYWDLETESVSADSIPGGQWRVSVAVRARKVVVDSTGAETEVPMNDWIQVGVFAPVPGGVHVLQDPLHVQLRRIHSGRQTITVTVPRRPLRAGIDPYHLLIDLYPEDNTTRIKQKGDANFDLI